MIGSIQANLNNVSKLSSVSFRSNAQNPQGVSSSSPDSFVSEKQKIKEILDKGIYNFKTEKGAEFSGNIKDFIESHIIEPKKMVKYEGLYHGTLRESGESIVENGFDAGKITRTKCGPGVSFTSEEYLAHELGGGYILRCDFEGNRVRTKYGYYQAIQNNQQVASDICNVLGIENNPTSFDEAMKIREITDKHVYDYTRNVLINELGIDAANDMGDYPSIPGCFVVFNTDCVSNVRSESAGFSS